MVVAAIVKSVLVAHFASCIHGAVKVAADNPLRLIPLNTKNDFDTLMREDIHGAGSHASRQDHSRTLLTQPHREHSSTMLRWGAEMAVTD